MFMGLLFCGLLLGCLAARPPVEASYTRSQLQSIDPEHAIGSSAYDAFIRGADEAFNSAVKQYGGPNLELGKLWLAQQEHFRVIVRHYFRDEQAWFWLPGGLLLLTGALMWRQAAYEGLQLASQRISPLAALGAAVGTAPLACIPGFVFARIESARLELWGFPPGIANIVGYTCMLAIAVLSLLAMTGLGMTAIREIRRSGGQFYGLRLALLEALFCPTVLVYCLTMGAMSAILLTVFRPYPPPWQAWTIYAIIALALMAVGVRGYWRLWKRLRRPAVKPIRP
jgi:hypothetical protein